MVREGLECKWGESGVREGLECGERGARVGLEWGERGVRVR